MQSCLGKCGKIPKVAGKSTWNQMLKQFEILDKKKIYEKLIAFVLSFFYCWWKRCVIVCYAECFHSFSSWENKNVQSHLNIIPFFLVKESNNFLTQSSRVTVPCSKESELRQQLTENPCPQKAEKRTQTAKSTLPQPVQSKVEPVKGTHVQLEPKGKPTTPGKLFFSFNKCSFKLGLCPVLKLHID